MKLVNHFIAESHCVVCGGNELAPNEQVVILPVVYMTTNKTTDSAQIHFRCLQMLEPMLYFSEGDNTQIIFTLDTPTGIPRHDIIDGAV